MARLWSSGFELNSTTANVEWTAAHSTPSIQTTTVRSGTYTLQITSLGSGTAIGLRYQFASAAGNGPYYFRTYFRVATLPSAENRIILLNDSADLTTPIVYITIDNSGVLRLYDEDGQITGTTTLSVDIWYNIEIKIDATPAAGSDVVEARVDEAAAFATSSARSLSAGIHTLAVGGNLNSEAQTTGSWFFDDIAVNNSTGSFQNTYPGVGEIIHLRPNATGDNSAWTGTNTNIDEVTPDDATTVISVDGSTLNQIEDVNLDATPAALASDDTINVVQVGVRFSDDGVGGGADSFVLRIKASSGGTTEESSAIAANTAAFNTNAVSVPRNYRFTLYDLPGASTTAWTKTDLDVAQIGVKNTTDNADGIRVTVLWLLVDHQPAAASAGGEDWPHFQRRSFWNWDFS